MKIKSTFANLRILNNPLPALRRTSGVLNLKFSVPSIIYTSRGLKILKRGVVPTFRKRENESVRPAVSVVACARHDVASPGYSIIIFIIKSTEVTTNFHAAHSVVILAEEVGTEANMKLSSSDKLHSHLERI